MSDVKIKNIVILAVAVIMMAVLIVRYNQLNDPDIRYDISDQEAHYGEYIEENNIGYHIYEPEVKKLYSEEYKQDVYRYKIPFDLENVTDDEPFDLEDFVSGISILSGGEKWQGNISLSGKRSSWIVGGNEKVKGNIVINVIPSENISKNLYDKYEFYYVTREPDVAFKTRFM